MKRIIIFSLLMAAAYSYALDPAQVQQDLDFNVQEVVARLDEHMTNVESWYATAKRCASQVAPAACPCSTFEIMDVSREVRQATRARDFDMALLKSVVQVAHPIMVECFAIMEKEHSLDPFFAVWHDFKNSYVQDKDNQLLCKEVAFLAIHLYNTMLGQLQRTGTRVSVSQMLELYHIIAALPIYELLALLDSIAREIIELLDQTYHGEDSFFVWLWHNWWVPPTVISHAVGSLVEGITQIMTAEKPADADAEKEDDHKSPMLRGIRH